MLKKQELDLRLTIHYSFDNINWDLVHVHGHGHGIQRFLQKSKYNILGTHYKKII